MYKKFLGSLIMFNLLFPNGISGVTFFEYHSGDLDKANEKHGFKLSRAYLTYKNDISDELSFKFQTDVGQVANDNRWTAYLKKAQLDWKMNNGMKISLGLIGMNMFNVQEKTWGNRFIEKTALDFAGWSSSADLGFGISKDLFNNISLSFLMTNGEGYKESSTDNYEKLSLQLVYGEKNLNENMGYNAGVVYSTLDSDQNSDPHIEEIENVTVSGIFVGAATNKLKFGLESYTKNDDQFETNSDISSNLTSYCLSYNITETITLMARADVLDPDDRNNTDIQKQDEITTSIVGFIWMPTEGLSIAPHATSVKKWDDWDNNIATTNIEDSMNNFAIDFQFNF